MKEGKGCEGGLGNGQKAWPRGTGVVGREAEREALELEETLTENVSAPPPPTTSNTGMAPHKSCALSLHL